MINHVSLTGRLTKDPILRVAAQTGMQVCKLSMALDRGKTKDGKSRGADYITVAVFGPAAEACERQLRKGAKISVDGRIHSGMYDDQETGRKVFTTEVYASAVEFMQQATEASDTQQDPEELTAGEQMGFILDDDIPF